MVNWTKKEGILLWTVYFIFFSLGYFAGYNQENYLSLGIFMAGCYIPIIYFGKKGGRKMMKEEFKSKYQFENRFHLHFEDRLSLIMLDPELYEECHYELYDLKEEKTLGRYSNIIKASLAVEYYLKKFSNGEK